MALCTDNTGQGSFPSPTCEMLPTTSLVPKTPFGVSARNHYKLGLMLLGKRDRAGLDNPTTLQELGGTHLNARDVGICVCIRESPREATTHPQADVQRQPPSLYPLPSLSIWPPSHILTKEQPLARVESSRQNLSAMRCSQQISATTRDEIMVWT